MTLIASTLHKYVSGRLIETPSRLTMRSTGRGKNSGEAWKMRRDVSTLSSAAERIRAREKRERQVAEQVTSIFDQIAHLQA